MGKEVEVKIGLIFFFGYRPKSKSQKDTEFLIQKMYIFDDFWYFGRYPKKSRVGLKKVEVTSTFLGNSTGQLLGIWE